MTKIDWSKFKVRCSAIHKILANSRSNPVLTPNDKVRLSELENRVKPMTDSIKEEYAKLIIKKENGKKIILSDDYITYLMEEYAWQTEGMKRVGKEFFIEQLEKGRCVQEESISLLREFDGVNYHSNIDKIRIYNDYLSGEVDAWDGNEEVIYGAESIVDTKSVWDYPTYLCKLHDEVSKANDWQVKGYMNISLARKGWIADCLVNAPPHTIHSFKMKLLNKMDVATEESYEFLKEWAILLRSMVFDNISPKLRVNKKSIDPMTTEEEQKVYDRVKIGRDWMCKFAEEREKLL